MKRFILFLTCCLYLTANAQEVTPTTEPQHEASAYDAVKTWYTDNMNYGSITLLMTIESSFIPFPSEIVVPPAAFVAQEEGSPLRTTDSYPINLMLIVLFASLGAMLGAIINYVLSYWLGRPIIYKFVDSKLGHLCLLSGEKMQKAEDYFNAHGKVSTFVGRLIPGIRQLISIPAGLAKMNFGVFLLYTFLGAFIWNTVLALLGYIARGQMSLIEQYNKELSYAIMAIVVLAVGIWAIKKLLERKK